MWKRIDVSQMSKQELFEHLKETGKIPADAEHYVGKSWKGAYDFWHIWNQKFYAVRVKRTKCLDEDLSVEVKKQLDILAADTKRAFAELGRQIDGGNKHIKIDTKEFSSAELFYLLKKLDAIPQDTLTPHGKDTPRNISAKIWFIKSNGYYRYGWNKREIIIDLDIFIGNIGYVTNSINKIIKSYRICDYDGAYSKLLYRAYELSGHPYFLRPNWLLTVLRYNALDFWNKERRHHKRYISYEGVLEKVGGADKFNPENIRNDHANDFIQSKTPIPRTLRVSVCSRSRNRILGVAT